MYLSNRQISCSYQSLLVRISSFHHWYCKIQQEVHETLEWNYMISCTRKHKLQLGSTVLHEILKATKANGECWTRKRLQAYTTGKVRGDRLHASRKVRNWSYHETNNGHEAAPRVQMIRTFKILNLPVSWNLFALGNISCDEKRRKGRRYNRQAV